MKRTLVAVIVLLALAAPASAQLNAQQQRMKDCNASAAGKKGDERKAFMSNCLKN